MIKKLIDAYELEREMYCKCIDTDEEIKKGRAKWDSGLWIRYKVFEETITLAQRADAVEVVRCKDCMYLEPSLNSDWSWCCYFDSKVRGDDFCSHGERREDAEH